ncbi:MAG: endonuclease III [Cyclobacteriaceae bacterium]|nr:endonuclease III [Cyclobacteriaceae bacterium]MDH4297446.1 endonuclease III [Cyclobacteriaceae bacterium]MDH5250874.1 endonuclease III [Cyclobacteriaceae bacterium]
MIIKILTFAWVTSTHMASQNWQKEIRPLIKKYKGKKHPLDYNNLYELLVMVVLSAQDSDRNINKLAPDLFIAFPDLKSLSKTEPEALYPFVKKIRNHRNKTKWLLELSGSIKEDKNIPTTLEALTKLPGIGRKSANVIMREAGVKAEGIIVDLHVVRVAPRLGIAEGKDPKKLEKQMMEVLTPKDWGDAGMAISFLGREICRPKNPKCPDCVMKKVCGYYKSIQT